MSGDDHRDDDPPRPASQPATDPDRAAILARRQRFIAIALTGLATAGCDKPAPKPEACLKVGVSEPKEPKTSDDGKAEDDGARASGSSGGDGHGTGGSSSGGEIPVAPTTASPTPCLEVAPPMPCLSPPRPCLKVAPPKPCLDVAPPPTPPKPPPSPCLRVAPPEDPKPAPRPCLKVKRP